MLLSGSVGSHDGLGGEGHDDEGIGRLVDTLLFQSIWTIQTGLILGGKMQSQMLNPYFYILEESCYIST